MEIFNDDCGYKQQAANQSAKNLRKILLVC